VGNLEHSGAGFGGRVIARREGLGRGDSFYEEMEGQKPGKAEGKIG
jgi:hypothetical protein